MRPGFYIPECDKMPEDYLRGFVASMRPGFYIPECVEDWLAVFSIFKLQ